MNKKDVTERSDLEQIVAHFYQMVLSDPIIGFIFKDVAKIELDKHLPIIVSFWAGVVFGERSARDTPNVLAKHLELNELISLKPGHFTRWLYLFSLAIDAHCAGRNAQLMKDRAEMVAKSISAALTDRKKSDMHLVLTSSKGRAAE